jgi:hypothetical protein
VKQEKRNRRKHGQGSGEMQQKKLGMTIEAGTGNKKGVKKGKGTEEVK